MTKDELIRLLTEDLSDLPGETVIILSKDAEGNGFSPLTEGYVGLYEATSTWSGDAYMTDEQREETGEPDEYFAAPDTAVEAIVLWPVN